MKTSPAIAWLVRVGATALSHCYFNAYCFLSQINSSRILWSIENYNGDSAAAVQYRISMTADLKVLILLFSLFLTLIVCLAGLIHLRFSGALTTMMLIQKTQACMWLLQACWQGYSIVIPWPQVVCLIYTPEARGRRPEGWGCIY